MPKHDAVAKHVDAETTRSIQLRTLFHDEEASVILRVEREPYAESNDRGTRPRDDRDEEEIGEGRAATRPFLQSAATRLSLETRFDNRSASTPPPFGIKSNRGLRPAPAFRELCNDERLGDNDKSGFIGIFVPAAGPGYHSRSPRRPPQERQRMGEEWSCPRCRVRREHRHLFKKYRVYPSCLGPG